MQLVEVSQDRIDPIVVRREDEKVDESTNQHDFLLEPLKASGALLYLRHVVLSIVCLAICIVTLSFVHFNYVALGYPVDKQLHKLAKLLILRLLHSLLARLVVRL